MAADTGVDQELELPGWWWGTNPATDPGGGHVHVVHPDQPDTGLCGLPVEEPWEARPPQPESLCADCCAAAMDLMYPPFAQLPPTGRHGGADELAEQPEERAGERTVVLPAVRDGDP